jgi:steroid delta-isomerase-like uncharacterized protein
VKLNQKGDLGNVKFAMPFVLVVLGLLVLPFALTQTSTPPTPQATLPQSSAESRTAATPATTDQPIDTLPRKYVDLWNTGDFDQMKSFFSPFYLTSHGPRVVVTEEMLRRVITFWRKSMPDLTFKIEDTVIQGDKVAMRLSLRATYKNVLFPFTIQPASDDPPRTIRAGEMLFFQIKDGKIAEIWEQYDELVMRQQMGGIWSVPKNSEPLSEPSSKPAPPAPKP